MGRKITVKINGRELRVKAGTTVLKIFEILKEPVDNSTLGAVINNRLMGLYQPVLADAEIQTIDYQTKAGANIYRRTLALILCEAFAQLYPEIRLEIGQSLGHGYYYTTVDEAFVSVEMLEKVEKRMRAIVDSDRPLRPVLTAVEEAMAYFNERDYPEKSLLLKQRTIHEVPWIIMGEFRDLVYGPVAPSTSRCDKFSLLSISHGFVLNFPDRNGHVMESLPKQDMLFAAYRETRSWNEMMGVWTVAQLNQACIDGTISDVIKVAEGLQEKKISRLSDRITENLENCRITLIAGPSSSGKTTTTKRLAVQLRVNGIQPKLISLDDYYINRLDTPKNPDGSYNYETIQALDLDLFNEHLEALLAGEEVHTPIYNFITGEREKEKFRPVKLGKRDVVLIEGIHALNPLLTKSIPANKKFKIYVSALTQLCIDDHNRIFTSDVRLMRRIVRDRRFRGYSAADTINQWLHVRAGEERYIFPYQEEADIMFDTSLVYEPAVIKPLLNRFLMEVLPEDEAYMEAYRLFKFLELFIPIFSHEVPPTSILREFIGGSAFHY